MARKALTTTQTPEEQLEIIIPRFGETKEFYDELDKKIKADNTEIKKLMREIGESEFEAGSYIAKMSTQERASFNDDLLINILKNLKEFGDLSGAALKKIIKVREYVDEEALESAIYNGVIDAAVLQPAQAIKEVVTLRVTKRKDTE